ncbi:uncharacterized protein Dvir_GJ26588 [Drosophila virilis]|uniref:Uncharacterized protein n=1 Tax=Drosophila virilis TaxID=7244 RepID=A0A0Q9WIZ2_DROVI|nr:uncharacterized protein LOC26531358 [Drosophila virilis]KRF84649.1 uncharacterized protein Dvir_GJ26588 [Drosophila virilis]
MFQLIPYDKQIKLMARTYKLKMDASRQSMEMLNLPNNYFFIMHRILLLMCLHGVLESLYIFTCHYCTLAIKLPTLWHNHRFLILPPELTRQLRCGFGFLHINAWLGLTYAALAFAPALMIPWLIYYYGFLGLHLLKLSIKVLGKSMQGEGIQTSIKLMGLSLKIAFVILCKRNYEAILKSMAI